MQRVNTRSVIFYNLRWKFEKESKKILLLKKKKVQYYSKNKYSVRHTDAHTRRRNIDTDSCIE